jgi:hypothetical protein
MVRQHDRLGALHVRVAREIYVLGVGLRRPAQDHLHEVTQPSGHRAALPADVEAQVERDLVVAAAAGVELCPGRTGQLRHPAFDGRVDVLVEWKERERAGVKLSLDPGERGGHDGPFLFVDQAHPGEHVDVGPGAGQVVCRQPRVERKALREVEQVLGGGVAETALPQRPAALRFGRLGHCPDPGAGAP